MPEFHQSAKARSDSLSLSVLPDRFFLADRLSVTMTFPEGTLNAESEVGVGVIVGVSASVGVIVGTDSNVGVTVEVNTNVGVDTGVSAIVGVSVGFCLLVGVNVGLVNGILLTVYSTNPVV